VSRRARVLGASLVLEHVPDLVRYGSKPDRERARFAAIRSKLRTYEEAVAYAPNQVFIGNLRPEELWTMERPWWASRDSGASSRGPAEEAEHKPSSGTEMSQMSRMPHTGAARAGGPLRGTKRGAGDVRHRPRQTRRSASSRDQAIRE